MKPKIWSTSVDGCLRPGHDGYAGAGDLARYTRADWPLQAWLDPGRPHYCHGGRALLLQINMNLRTRLLIRADGPKYYSVRR